MKIAMVTPFEEPVPPIGYGGTELVAYNLIEQFVKLGHEVTLIASGDSHTSAKLLEVIPQSLRTYLPPELQPFRERYKYICTGRVLDLLDQHEFDIVHNHLRWRLLPFANYIKAPIATTIHVALNLPEEKVCFEPFADANYVSISLNQRLAMPNLNYVGNVYNGIEVEKFAIGNGAGGYLAFLGRMSPEKGPLDAIKIAKATGQKLKMAAKVDLADKAYFESEIKPLVDGKQIEFIGEVNHEAKVDFLGNASALLMPIHWEEPFGLVTVEAFACGTPVIGLAQGSLPEIIADEKVGYICENVDEMIARVSDLPQIDRTACREYASEHFSAEHMAKDYLKVFQQIIDAA